MPDVQGPDGCDVTRAVCGAATGALVENGVETETKRVFVLMNALQSWCVVVRTVLEQETVERKRRERRKRGRESMHFKHFIFRFRSHVRRYRGKLSPLALLSHLSQTKKKKQAASRVQSAAKAGPAGRSTAARLRDLLDEQEAASIAAARGSSSAQQQQQLGLGPEAAVDAAELDAALARLAACRATSASAAADADLRLLLQFLRHARARKQSRLEQLRGELDVVEADLALVSACCGVGGGGMTSAASAAATAAATAATAAADAAAASNLLSVPATVPSLEDRARGASSPGSDFETAPAVPAIGGAGGGGGGAGGSEQRLLLTNSATRTGGGATTAATTTTTMTTATAEEGGSAGAGGSGGRRTRRSARTAPAVAAAASAEQAIVFRGSKEKETATTAATTAANNIKNDHFNTALALFDPSAAHSARKRRVAAQFDSLQECYLSLRREREGEAAGVAAASGSQAAALPSSVDAVDASAVAEMLNGGGGAGGAGSSSAAATSSQTGGGGLAEFSRLLSTFVRCSELEFLARLPATGGGGSAVSSPPMSSRRGANAAAHSTPALPPASPRLLQNASATPRSIISSLDFDASGRWLAAAAVAKRVSVFDFEEVLRAGESDLIFLSLLLFLLFLLFSFLVFFFLRGRVKNKKTHPFFLFHYFLLKHPFKTGRAERRWNERREQEEEEEEEGQQTRRRRRCRRRRAVRWAGSDGDANNAPAPQPPRPVFELSTRSKLSCAVWAKTRSELAAAARRRRIDYGDEGSDESGDDANEDDDEGRHHPPPLPPPPLLVATDYSGCATVWDLESSARPIAEYDAHDRRAWAADWSPARGGCSVFATASDDGTAKVWALNVNPSCSSGSAAANAADATSAAASSTSTPVITLDVRANVCSAAFDASDPAGNILALGAADHAIRVYDLRNPSVPLQVLSGHRKAASYVRWGAGGLVSASTDSTLRLWPLPRSWPRADSSVGGGVSTTAASAPLLPRPPRVFKGHVNERNFVGLAADPRHDLLAAGSETGEVVVWHASMARPVAKVRVRSNSSVGSGVGGIGGGDSGGAAVAAAAAPPPFVSAVAWRPLPYDAAPSKASSSLHDVENATYTLVAANAHGTLQVMRLGGGGGGAGAKAERIKRRRREEGIAAGEEEDEDDYGFDDDED